MQLRHIYSIATILNEAFNRDELNGANINDMEVTIKVNPPTLYGIDREFYSQTHDGSTEGFVHNKKIDAIIDNVHFVLIEKVEGPS